MMLLYNVLYGTVHLPVTFYSEVHLNFLYLKTKLCLWACSGKGQWENRTSGESLRQYCLFNTSPLTSRRKIAITVTIAFNTKIKGIIIKGKFLQLWNLWSNSIVGNAIICNVTNTFPQSENRPKRFKLKVSSDFHYKSNLGCLWRLHVNDKDQHASRSRWISFLMDRSSPLCWVRRREHWKEEAMATSMLNLSLAREMDCTARTGPWQMLWASLKREWVLHVVIFQAL